MGAVSAPQTFTLTNSGTGPLAVGTVTLTGPDADSFASRRRHVLGRDARPGQDVHGRDRVPAGRGGLPACDAEDRERRRGPGDAGAPRGSRARQLGRHRLRPSADVLGLRPPAGRRWRRRRRRARERPVRRRRRRVRRRDHGRVAVEPHSRNQLVGGRRVRHVRRAGVRRRGPRRTGAFDPARGPRPRAASPAPAWVAPTSTATASTTCWSAPGRTSIPGRPRGSRHRAGAPTSCSARPPCARSRRSTSARSAMPAS